MEATLPAPPAAVVHPPGRQSATPLALQPGAMLRLRRVHDLHMQVQAGRVWLTHSGSPDDHILAAGQAIALRDGHDVLIECDGTGPARLQWWAKRRW